LSRIEAQPVTAEVRTADAALAAREIAVIYHSRARDAGIIFHSEIPEAVLPVRMAEVQMKQLLTNLLDNAIQFTATGRKIRLSVKRSGNVVEIQVADEGLGIESELLPKIFDRFFTTENPRTGTRGTGLGLAIARSIVNANGGRIGVESELGRGSTFTVIFPAA
jgi:signal transduction histidine kinase